MALPDSDKHAARELQITEACAKHGVHIAPGSSYREEEYGWFRVTFTTAKAPLEEGIRRIVSALTELRADETAAPTSETATVEAAAPASEAASSATATSESARSEAGTSMTSISETTIPADKTANEIEVPTTGSVTIATEPRIPTTETATTEILTSTTKGTTPILDAAAPVSGKADKERALYRAAVTRVSPTRKDFPNYISDELRVATAMLDGEIEYRRGNTKEAFKHLRDAIHYDDTLLYSEPWGWMQPTRHAFAALSLEQGNVEDALQAYAEDLGLDDTLTRAHTHPNNVWALHGYHECLIKLGRKDEARVIKKQLDLASAWADIEITASCACRLDVFKETAPTDGIGNGDIIANGCCH